MTDGTMMGGLVAGGGRRPEAEGHEPKSGTVRTLWLVLFFVQVIFALEALGVWESWLGLSLISTTTLPITIPLFLAISFWAFFAFKEPGIIDGENLKLLGKYILISACYIIIVPWAMRIMDKYISFGSLPLAQIVSFSFYVCFPWWLWNVANSSGDDELLKYTRWWYNLTVIAIIFLFIVYFATEFNATDILARGGSGDIVKATNVVEYISDAFVKVIKNIWKTISITDNIKGLLNATGIAYYTGMVDQNEKAPVGLYITNVRAQDRVSYVGSPAVVWADIEGKSFTEVMKITPFCYTDGSGNKRIEGEPSPSYIEIFGEEHDSIRCTFDNLQKGTYRAMVGAGFNFETWAYVTYTFVDLELARSMAIEGKNINSELDVPIIAQAVYSNGPIFVGMGNSVDQPVGIDKVKNDREPIIGVALNNKWTDGHLERVNEFILQVPDDFDLVDCDRGKVTQGKATPYETQDGYSYYKFTREELADPRIEFISLTCRLHIKEPTKFLAGQQKVQRTFATQVKYDYFIQKSASITVKE